MIPEWTPQATPAVPFDIWRQRLRCDCQRCDKLYAFEDFGDFVLQLLWQSGVEPTVRSIIQDQDLEEAA